ncbi:MAG: hypothetical protein IJ025_09005 [Clostridia bacterium]|nr:hypothetical protein [Clostridia bacterium]
MDYNDRNENLSVNNIENSTDATPVIEKHNPAISQEAQPANETNNQKKKSVLPYILLPVAMFVAQLINSGIVAVSMILGPILQTELGITPQASSLINSIGSIIGGVLYIAVIIAFSLCCKTLVKKVLFVTSTYVGAVSSVFSSCLMLVLFSIFFIIGEMPYTTQTLVISLVTSLNGILSSILAIAFAVIFFIAIDKYKEKRVEGEAPAFSFKKFLVPSILIVIVGVISLITNTVNELVPATILESTGGFGNVWGSFVVTNATSLVGLIIFWGALIGLSFIIKDKYKRLTFICSTVSGRGIVDIITTIGSMLASLLPVASGGVNFIFRIIFFAISAAAGILIYILLNKKEYEKV